MAKQYTYCEGHATSRTASFAAKQKATFQHFSASEC